MTDDLRHKSVLLDEAVDQLVVRPDGVYFDGTFGRGGHSRLILEHLSPAGQLVATDKDPRAIEAGNALAMSDSRFRIAKASFSEMRSLFSQLPALDGILLDLGVSSPQLDDASRGFSFLRDGPLDMRMDPDSGESAADWVNRADEKEMADVFFKYGEEKHSRRIAKAIVSRRTERRFETTLDFASLVAEANPAWERHKNPATRVFQAIRIFINNELGDLEQLLADSIECLKPGGRLVVISFHSLEDRIVKRFIQANERGQAPQGVPLTEDQIVRNLRRVGKALKASPAEIEQNVRARSAVMRIAERMG